MRGGQASTMMDIGRDIILLDSHSDTDSSASDNQNLVENVAEDNHPQTLMVTIYA